MIKAHIRGEKGVLSPVNQLFFVPNPVTNKGVSPQNPIPPILAPKITVNRLNLTENHVNRLKKGPNPAYRLVLPPHIKIFQLKN